MFSIKKLTSLLGGALIATSFTLPAKADTLRFAVGFPSGHLLKLHNNMQKR